MLLSDLVFRCAVCELHGGCFVDHQWSTLPLSPCSECGGETRRTATRLQYWVNIERPVQRQHRLPTLRQCIDGPMLAAAGAALLSLWMIAVSVIA